MRLISGFISKFTGLKLKTILFLSSVVMVVVFLLFTGYISYKETADVIMNNISNADESNLKQVNNKFTSVIEEMKKLTGNISENSSLISNINEFEEAKDDPYKRIQVQSDILSQLVKKRMFYSGIDSINVYVNDTSFTLKGDKLHLTEREVRLSDIYKKIKSSGDNIAVIEPYFKDGIFKNVISGISFGSIIYDNGKEIGSVVVIMNQRWMDAMSGPGANVVFGSKNNNLLWAGNGIVSAIYSQIPQFLIYDKGNLTYRHRDEDYRIYYMQCKYNDWLVVTFKKVSDVLPPLNKVRNYAFIAIIISMAMSFMLSRIISRKIAGPVYNLIEAAKKYRVQDKIEYVNIEARRKSFRENVMIYMIVVITVPILLYNITFFLTTSEVLDNNFRESVLTVFKQTTGNIDSFLERNERISTGIIFNKYVQNYLANIIDGIKSPMYTTDRVYKEINVNMSIGKDSFDTHLYGIDGRLVFSTSSNSKRVMDKSLYRKASGTFGEAFWVYNDKGRQLLLVRKIFEIPTEKYYSRPIGYIVISFFESNIEVLYSDINLGDSNVYIIDNTGVIVSHKDKSLVGQSSGYKPDKKMTDAGSRVESINGKKYLFIYTGCSNLPWILVGEIPYKEILKDSNKIMVQSILIQIIIMFIALFAAYGFSFKFTKSMNMLNNKLIRLGSGEDEVDFTEGIHINEVEELGKTFNNMAQRIQKLIKEVLSSHLKEKELENEKKDAELIALQAQINPHFLYNTLESIKWMIKENEKNIASEMVTSLGDLFRLGISNEKSIITIEEEIKYAKTYLHIQEQRFGKKLQFQWFVDVKILCCMTPKLLLQPLIENAIHHGVQSRAGVGKISIYCFEEDGLIVFRVIDDGVGIEAERLDEIKHALNGELAAKSIGMFNVQKRIKLYFGEAYGISMESSPGAGTTVTVRIPKNTGNNYLKYD